MALVLCCGVNELLVQTRVLILEKAGHKVIPALREEQASAACAANKFEVAVVGQAMSAEDKRRVSHVIRQHCPTAQLLELYTSATGRILHDADAWLLVPADVPGDLAHSVAALAAGR